MTDPHAALIEALDAQETARRAIDGASGEQRATADAALTAATAKVEEAERQVREAARTPDGFGGQEEAPAAVPTRDPDNLTIRHSLGRGGALGRQGLTITHHDPELVAARLAATRSDALSATLAQERATRVESERARADAERRDMDAAARLYEGLPQNRGIDRSTYRHMEMERRHQLDEDPGRRATLTAEARARYIEERSHASGIRHREVEAGECVRGKIIGVRRFEGEPHLIIETNGPEGTERIVIAGEYRNATLYREVVIEADENCIMTNRKARDRAPERDF